MTTTPGKLLLGYGKRTWSKSPITDSTPQFYFPDFFLTHEQPWFTHPHRCELHVDDLLEQLIPNTSLPTNSWIPPNQHAFSQAFDDLKNRFASGELQKAVPYAFETTSTKMTLDRLSNTLIRLLTYAKSHPIHVYGFWDSQQGILGGTPEILFDLEKKPHLMLKTMACAGTAKKDPKALLKSSKDQQEHRFVIEDLSQALAKFGKLFIGETTVTQLPGLMHLITPITVSLKSNPSFETIVAALHPTAALGAFPREEGTHWLRHYQTQMSRKRFGAPAGFLYRDNATCYVAIRNAQWDAHGIAIGAGCGVVSASECEKEWKEIQLKIRTIKDLLNL